MFDSTNIYIYIYIHIFDGVLSLSTLRTYMKIWWCFGSYLCRYIDHYTGYTNFQAALYIYIPLNKSRTQSNKWEKIFSLSFICWGKWSIFMQKYIKFQRFHKLSSSTSTVCVYIYIYILFLWHDFWVSLLFVHIPFLMFLLLLLFIYFHKVDKLW